ncbi:glycine/betaine/sarcosine/D-proline family reductase selenoprotein B [Clostridium sp. KNHs216]|uniref:glycine/betaine/sarcosine/D-proline family reductase selenoprotein B n=1 Tax=Clostridium sp. KNHs216 TaxID=1550235 RepID=UPI001153EE86|nr:glycine/betaine/sarcosine/D-proline family reductase selenoprotein B [Clostridium sp. KNHs216]TQI68103.1 glycine reductase [Clostridium sp. KNHs216]
MIRVVQFLNQIQAGLGGDERMDIEPRAEQGAVGMGMLLRTMLMRKGADIVGTVICGDHYFLENREEAAAKLTELIRTFRADVVICGPALNHKRFGECCGYLAEALESREKIPAFAAMAKESTGTELFRNRVYIIKTPKVGGTGLNASLRKIADFAVKKSKGEPIGSPEEEGYFKRD